jgi:hypothetical protein
MTNFSSAAMGIAMVTALLLLLGGAKLAFDGHTRGRGILMMIAAAVLIMNVMIWTV